MLRLTADVLGVDRRRVPELLERVGLPKAAAKKRVGNYSLGMRQRLGIAQALMGEPEVLILDEPANGLDPEGIFWMRELLRDFADRAGTVLLSSHLLREIEVIADEPRGDRRRQDRRPGRQGRAAGGDRHARPRGRSPRRSPTGSPPPASPPPRPPDGSLVVEAEPETVGRLAAELGLALIELRPADGGGLEQLFLTLTSREEVAA